MYAFYKENLIFKRRIPLQRNVIKDGIKRQNKNIMRKINGKAKKQRKYRYSYFFYLNDFSAFRTICIVLIFKGIVMDALKIILFQMNLKYVWIGRNSRAQCVACIIMNATDIRAN